MPDASPHTENPDDPDERETTWTRRILGDIHVGALGGNVKRVPGAGTAKGEKAIAKAMSDVLDRVRRSIRERSVTPSTTTRS